MEYIATLFLRMKEKTFVKIDLEFSYLYNDVTVSVSISNNF